MSDGLQALLSHLQAVTSETDAQLQQLSARPPSPALRPRSSFTGADVLSFESPATKLSFAPSVSSAPIAYDSQPSHGDHRLELIQNSISSLKMKLKSELDAHQANLDSKHVRLRESLIGHCGDLVGEVESRFYSQLQTAVIELQRTHTSSVQQIKSEMQTQSLAQSRMADEQRQTTRSTQALQSTLDELRRQLDIVQSAHDRSISEAKQRRQRRALAWTSLRSQTGSSASDALLDVSGDDEDDLVTLMQHIESSHRRQQLVLQRVQDSIEELRKHSANSDAISPQLSSVKRDLDAMQQRLDQRLAEQMEQHNRLAVNATALTEALCKQVEVVQTEQRQSSAQLAALDARLTAVAASSGSGADASVVEDRLQKVEGSMLTEKKVSVRFFFVGTQ